MAYNNPASWGDLSINDESFLALLQKQIAAANPQSLVLDPSRFPAPPAENITPPLSENSSPSPPSFQDAFGDEKEHYRSGGYGDESSKRKVYDDSDDEEELDQPLHKSQHRAGDSNASKKSNKRKSAGGSNPDESRLLKRKEQNRAAQRAFRERKEKRVKDLEDQVAVLETKTQSQDRENENLRDLLGRLQNENLQLKQSAFTFSFGGNAKSPTASTSQSSPALRSAASPKLPSPASSSSVSTPESTGQNQVYSDLFPLAASSTSSISTAATPQSIAPSSQFQHSPTAAFNTLPDFSGIDFSNTNPVADDSGGSKKHHYTTIASNPMFTSYQDPVLDPMAWASFGPGDGSFLSSSDMDMNLFGKSDFGIGSFGMAGQTGLNGGYDDLFGGQDSFVAINDFGHDLSSPSSFGMISMDSSPSPVLHANSNLGNNTSLFGSGSAPSSATAASPPETQHSEGVCPRTAADVKRIMDKSPPSTFGAPIAAPPVTRRETDEKDAAAHARMASLCSDLPKTVKKPGQIEIGRAWEQVRRHPRFQECDIDELCAELSAKARCDGSRPVLEEESYNDIVNSLPAMPRK